MMKAFNESMDLYQNQNQEKYLKMAVQTILFNYKHQLDQVVNEGSNRILDQMAWEITSLAKHFEKITNETMKGLEQS